MSDTNEEKKERTQSERYNDTEADVVIVSSNEVEFRVHSYQLMAASATFRSMFSLAKRDEQRGEVVMVDKTIEHSLVIRAVLDVIHDLQVPAQAVEDIQLLSYMVDFTYKWDFAKVPQVISQALIYSMVDSSPNASNLLRLAGKLHDHEIVPRLSRTADGMNDNPANPVIESRSSTTAFGNIGHPGGMDWETYRELPPEITWAWARAFARDSSSLSEQRSVDDYKRISDRYKAVVRDLVAGKHGAR